ncbi:BRO-N domain-containing protein [Metabacillus halosaccharovorans]|uniref:BRO-N domain-containing protein n=1 Tax=Metabacillus halosaccharovorans TaxID=930124 RepID=UPI000994BF71|nr:BRO family protein [Metabacillus halosaccharovorans]
MNQLHTFKNEIFEVAAKIEKDQILFDIEQVATSLGFTQIKNNKEYIRWETVNRYLNRYVSQDVGKGDFIPEPLVYKLAFKASNEIAEQFQDWLAIEVIPSIRKNGSYQSEQPKSQLEILQISINQLVEQEKRLTHVEKRLVETEKRQENISDIVALNPNDWRKQTTKIVNRIAKKTGGYEQYRNIRNESYELLENRAGANLSIRVTNKKKKMAFEGMATFKIDKVSKLDVIGEDKRLLEIYLAIVKEMAIKYDVELEGESK